MEERERARQVEWQAAYEAAQVKRKAVERERMGEDSDEAMSDEAFLALLKSL